MTITALCLFCGLKVGVDPAYADLATGLGRVAAARGVTLVYGGDTDGLMGLAASAALTAGGRVVGVVPQARVADESAQPGLTELVVAATRHACRAAMLARTDAVVVLPGGVDTMDPLFAVMAAKTLGRDARPVFLLGGAFWRPFCDLLGHLDRAGFAGPGLFALVEPLGLEALDARLAA